jgi:hypothetical protein
MSRRLLLPAIFLAAFAAACGGGQNVVVLPPPPVQGNFSNASLNGKYAFSMTGTEDCGLPSFFGRIGSFTADGNGHITGGVEDVNNCTGVATLRFLSGAYSISADGRGTLTLTNSTGTTNYSITLSTTAAGYIIQTDLHATAGGSFQKQDPAAFSLTQIAGGYVFDISGVSANVLPESIVGRFTADGGGGISQGQFDDNEDGTPTGPFSFSGSYLLDATFGSDGRGTADIAGQNLIFYIVDGTRLKFISSDADLPAALVGEAFAQQNISFNLSNVNGSFAFLIGGSFTSANATGPIVTAGRFTADGAGNLSAIVLDENNTGVLTQLPTGTVTGSYTVDANGLGRGTMTWDDSTAGTFEFVFYLISPTRAVFQETDNGITSDGFILAQTSGAITNASLAGDYAFIWTGVEFDTGNEEDFVGQVELTSASSSNASGLMDFNEFGQAKLFLNFPISGALTLGSNPAARNTYQVTANAPPNPRVTFNYSAYVVDANTVLLIGTDKNRVIAGNLARQP